LLRIVVFAVAILAWIVPGQAATRVALVIGNGAYTSLAPTLPNPSRDAAAISAALTELGFAVDTVIDGTKSAMDDALARLAREARSADVVLLFYAGHGIQDQGRNYLAPVDAALGDETDLRRRFIRLDDVLDDLSSAKGARILLLDACRDNDAVEALRTAVTPSRAAGVTRGLARVSAADGQLVAFATQPDRVATDGEGDNSPFTTALVKHIKTPGIELRTALTRVRVDVANATGNDQIPEVTDSLLGEIYLSSTPTADGAATAPAPTPAPTPAPPVVEAPATTPPTGAATETPTPPAGSSDDARAAWDAVKDTTSVAVLKTFLTHYPQGLYADFATARIAELEAAAERIAALEAEARPAATPPPAPAPEVETATREAEPDDGADIPQAGGGNWFVVLGSFPHADRRKATRRLNSLQSQGIDAELIDTDDYPNLTDGYYAVVLGPYSKATAQRTLPNARQYVADAYIKAGS
jgi:uncharacterized caspase-like protein